jgi:bile acid-coenzyme A ligase
MTERVSLGRAITLRSQAQGDATAITCGAERIGWRDLDGRTNALARDFAGLGVARGDVVMISMPNSIDFFVAVVAAWKIGATPAPLPSTMPTAEFEHYVALANPALVVGRAAGRRWLSPGHVGQPTGSTDSLPDVVPPAWKIAATGGSTGRPKLVVADRSGTFADKDAGIWLMRPDDTQLVCGPLYHAGPFMMSILGLCLGQQLVVLPRFDAAAALDAIAAHQVTWLCVVPTMMARMLSQLGTEESEHRLQSLRCLWHLGAPCPAWLKRRWIGLLGPERIMELYGGTEAQAMTAIRGDEWLARPGSVGRPFYGEIKVVDEAGQMAAPGAVGEILMRPPDRHGTKYRYLGAEPSVRDGWDTLGDLGWLDADGYLYIADRRTDLIVTGGANVYPAEVEAAIEALPGVDSSVVVGLPDGDLGQRVHAVISADRGVTADGILAQLSHSLVRYKVPRSIEIVAYPLRDEAGKVRRSEVRAASTRRLSGAGRAEPEDRCS